MQAVRYNPQTYAAIPVSSKTCVSTNIYPEN